METLGNLLLTLAKVHFGLSACFFAEAQSLHEAEIIASDRARRGRPVPQHIPKEVENTKDMEKPGNHPRKEKPRNARENNNPMKEGRNKNPKHQKGLSIEGFLGTSIGRFWKGPRYLGESQKEKKGKGLKIKKYIKGQTRIKATPVKKTRKQTRVVP